MTNSTTTKTIGRRIARALEYLNDPVIAERQRRNAEKILHATQWA